MSVVTGAPWLLAHKSMLKVNQPYKISLYNQDYVFWKDRQGNVSALPNACPHVGSMLSEGWCEEDRETHSCKIVCPYHALKFDSDGCTVLPGSQKKTLPQLKPLDLIIQGDFIWSYGGYEPKMPIPNVLNELTENYDFIDYTADSSAEVDLKIMLMNMHDYNHQTGTHYEPMRIKEVRLQQFIDEGYKSHAVFDNVTTPRSLPEKLLHPYLFLMPDALTTHLENHFPNLTIIHSVSPFGKVAQCQLFVPEKDTRTRIYVLLFIQLKASFLKHFIKKRFLEIGKVVIDQDMDMLTKIYPHTPQKIRLNNEVGIDWIKRNFNNFPKIVPPNVSSKSPTKSNKELIASS
jgi:phenylpropionate dioxygenase-like ring-hydroxylating dioxygenase large terminal subunit